MTKSKAGIFILLIFFAGVFSHSQEKNQVFSLSLEECIVKAMENNLSVAIEVLNPELAELEVARAKEKFMPSLSLSFNKQNIREPSRTRLDAADVLTQNSNDYSAQISQTIPTGGSFSVNIDSSRYDMNRTGTHINPSYSSRLAFNFQQPLLKNFGLTISRREIIVAKNRLEVSGKDFQKALQDTVYSVEEAYWNLVYAVETLKVRQKSLKLAGDLLERNRRAVEIGTMAPIEIINAQASVAQREADILAAEAAVKNNEDILKTILNLGVENKQLEEVNIIPTDSPTYEKKEISLDEALSIAMNNRPDLQASRINLKNTQIDLTYAKNQMLPELNLSASYWSPGVSGTQLIYAPDDPYGIGDPIDVIPGGASGSLKDMFNFRYRNWAIGFTLNIPVNNILSRAAYAQAKVNLEQSQLSLKYQEQQVFRDIKIAVRDAETNFKRIQAYQAARELAEKQLEAEEEKLKVGLSTNYYVLQYQTTLADSLTQELKAIIDFNLSLARLNRDLGINLKEKNIKTHEVMRD